MPKSSVSPPSKALPRWLLYAFLSLFWWGLFGFLGKLGTGRISPEQMQVLYMIGFVPLVLAALHRVHYKVDTNKRGITYSILMGLSAALGVLTFFVAMKAGEVSIVAPMTSLYPVLTVVLALVILKERLNWLQVLGLFLAIVSIVLLSL